MPKTFAEAFTFRDPPPNIGVVYQTLPDSEALVLLCEWSGDLANHNQK